MPDYGLVPITQAAAFAPDPANFDGALAITPSQYGATNSGLTENADDKKCDQAMSAASLPGVFQSPFGYAGLTCSLTWMLVAAMTHDPGLSPAGLAAGLQRAGTSPYAYPYGPENYTPPGTTTAGQFWRPVTFHSSCTCWKVDDPTFKASF